MNEQALNQFHEYIVKHRDVLQEMLTKDDAESKKLLKDASVQQIIAVMDEFKGLLEKIEHKNYGTCVVCQGEVELERLEQDCTTNVCLDCYSEEQLRELERDLELAAKVQKQLLPTCVPSVEGIEFAVRYESAQAVGGDYYDFFTLKNGQQGFVIGDVMGKGLAASMLMSNLQASLRILGPDYDRLENLARHLNRLFRYNLKLIRFISLFLGAADLQKRKLHYCNAGHHAPLFWDTLKREIRWLTPTAPAIGLIAEPEFGLNTIRFNPGDMLLLYTDGLIEARNQKNLEFGEKRLSAFMQENHRLTAEKFLEMLWKSVKDFTIQPIDDTTLMVLKFS